MQESLFSAMGEPGNKKYKTYREAFNVMDIYDEGYLRRDNIRHVLKLVGSNPTDKLLNNVIMEVDMDENEKINFNEFIELLRKLESQKNITKEAKDAFNAFDFMGEGYVAANDVKEALLHVMEKAPEFEKKDVVKYYKLNHNRKIYFEEFCRMISTTFEQYAS